MPVLPVGVPGAAVSPGSSNCNLAAAPEFTVMAGLVLAALVPSLTSLAVIIWEPAVAKVTLKVWAPASSAASAGRIAFGSDVVMPTVSTTVLIRFQKSSTARTVTLNAVPAVRTVGEPVLPVIVPGAAVSPGTSNCSLANAAGFTVKEGLVLAV